MLPRGLQLIQPQEESCSSWGWGIAYCLVLAACPTGMLGRGNISTKAAPFPSTPGQGNSTSLLQQESTVSSPRAETRMKSCLCLLQSRALPWTGGWQPMPAVMEGLEEIAQV